MSIGSIPGLVASAAGAPSAQSKAEVERSSTDVGAQQRQVFNERKAEAASGIGETDGQDHEASDRDADGRLPWKFFAAETSPPEGEEYPAPPAPLSRDPTGEAGNLLDLSG